MNPPSIPSLSREPSFDSLVSYEDLFDELYNGAEIEYEQHDPTARPIYGHESYEHWTDARKFPRYGLRNYGRNTVRPDKVPYIAQIHTMTKPVDQLKQDFDELRPLRRIPNPPEGIPQNRQYSHGKGFPKTITFGGTIIDLTNDEVAPTTPAEKRINGTTYYFDDDSDYEPPSSSSSKRPAPASSASSSSRKMTYMHQKLSDLTGDPDQPVDRDFIKFKHVGPKLRYDPMENSESEKIYKKDMKESLKKLKPNVGKDCTFFDGFGETLRNNQSVHIVEYDGMPVAAARAIHHAPNDIEIEFLCGNLKTHMGGGHAMVRHITNIAKNNKDEEDRYLMSLHALPSAVNAYKNMGLHFYNRYPQLEALPTMYTDDNKPLNAMRPGTHPIGLKTQTTTRTARTNGDLGIPEEAPDSGYPDNGYNDENALFNF